MFRSGPFPLPETGELMLKDLAPDGFQGMGFIWEISLIVVPKEVRVLVRAVVSTDWLVPG